LLPFTGFAVGATVVVVVVGDLVVVDVGVGVVVGVAAAAQLEASAIVLAEQEEHVSAEDSEVKQQVQQHVWSAAVCVLDFRREV
jgi:Tfp pilus assembly protein PilN